ncbi:hypothetical protein Fmac_018243 [Flemingia macrophylla]|uniref:DUF7745 domain-containing protein n=1 Tax=Flemingia macrophylla TaxID=520843 RepID=A0ABD1M4V0_9FABA
MEWKAKVEHWSIDHFSWISPWFHPGDVLIWCGNYPSIPLMGLRGCIAYSPKLAMRKLMRTKTIHSQEELGGLCFFYDSDHQDEMRAICKAWEKPIFKWWEVAQQRTTSLSEFCEKEKKGLAQISRICEERDRAIDKVNELQALIGFYKQKAKEAQIKCYNMSHAVHQ